jgi:hypothetical protein
VTVYLGGDDRSDTVQEVQADQQRVMTDIIKTVSAEVSMATIKTGQEGMRHEIKAGQEKMEAVIDSGQEAKAQ